ncbi:conserved protein of unknown function [Paraburkholderia dioscoreae]|uniref:Uncharacterized protein n=1 Tax=Paraburkholderia dioscoreae TaxID=2604047 RepID=A0A5Q4Z8H3_9BURK|nr:conserved protein of unknown function [Paraburkholderia dioscoreae]
MTRVRRFIVVHRSCGQVRGQCVEFSKKAKRNNGVRWGARGAGKLFVAWLPGGALDGGPKPALREASAGNVDAGANAGEACSRGILLISIRAAIHDTWDWPSG